MNKSIAALVVAAVVLLGSLLFLNRMVGHNDYQNYQVCQSPFGHVTVIDNPGFYVKGFSSVWTYPRAMEAEYTQKATRLSPNDDSIRATFNDGGTADISSYVRITLPTDAEQRLKLHQQFSASTANVASAVKNHLTNCIKASGPVMSASENQASRKAEFNQIIEEQLGQGLFKMRRTQIDLDDLATIEETKDEAGNKVTHEKKARVQATEIVLNKDGKPIIIQESPLKQYGIGISQFSITEIEYDKTTLEQFSAKKRSYLAAEQAKAERQQEVQQRLMLEEKGRRQVAEVQAEENQKKERALIQANQAAEVAIVNKMQAVTAAQQRTEVAEQTRLETSKLNEIAAIKVTTAELDKKAAIAAAEARQKSIELGGFISEEKRTLAQIAADRDVRVAEALSKMAVPGVIVQGSGEKAEPLTNTLTNLWLMQSQGLIKRN